MKKFYNYLVFSILFIFISGFATGQSSEYKYIENFESFPSDWGVFNRNQPGPTNYTWFKSTSSSLIAYNGTYSSFLVTGVTTDAKEGDNISQWVFTKPFKVSNGDIISFYTKNLYGTGADRLQVRLAKTGSPYVGAGSTALGNFDILMRDINAANSDDYPNDWSQFTDTVKGLADGEVVEASFGFRYYVPNVGCITCSPLPETMTGLSEEDEYLIGIALDAGTEVLGEVPYLGNFVEGASLVWAIGTTGFDFLSSISGGTNRASMIGIDNFVYNPADIKFESENGNHFTHANNPTISAAEFQKNMCLSNDIQKDIDGENALTFKIHNNGVAFNITGRSITGTNAADFGFVYGLNPGSGIPGNYHGDAFKMRFAPSSPGNKEAIVVLTTNHPGYPQIKFKITGVTLGNGNAPTIECRNNVNIILNASGQASIAQSIPFYDANAIDIQDLVNLMPQGTQFQCDFSNLTWSLPYGGKNYTSADAGRVDTFTIRGIDTRFGSITQCLSTVTIKDVTPPTITITGNLPDATYYLHRDSAIFYTSQLIKPTSAGSDNSGQIIAIPGWSSNIIGGHGKYGLTWEFMDQSGNKAFGTLYQIIYVKDTIAPVAICQNVQASYQGTEARIQATELNDSSYDKSSQNLIFGIWNGVGAVPKYGVTNDPNLASFKSFDCSFAGSTQQVKLVVKDGKTNQQSTCLANVTLPAPGTGYCKNATVNLRPLLPSETLYTSQVYVGTGSCFATNINLSKSSFDCSNIGLNTVTVTATAANGQVTQCTSQVKVLDFPSYDPEKYASDSVITVYMDDPTWPSVGVTFYQPYGLRCNTAYWSFTSTGSTFLNEDSLTTWGASASFYPGTTFLKKVQVHPTTGRITTIRTTINVIDTLKPHVFWNQHTMDSWFLVDSCEAPTKMYCPYVPFSSSPSEVIEGYWGYILTGATQKIVSNRFIGPEPNVMDYLNEGLTHVKFFGVDVSGNKADTVYLDINTYRPYPSNYPVKKCNFTVIPAEHAEPFTFNIIDPIDTKCSVIDATHTWEYSVTDPMGSYTYFSGQGLHDQQTATITLNGAKYNPNNTQNGMYKITKKLYPINANNVCYDWVDLRDRTAPAITCPAVATYQLDQGVCNMPLVVDRPLNVSNSQNKWYYTISGAGSYSSPVMNYSTASSSSPALGIGDYTLTIYGKDSLGNISSCSTTFKIEDVIAPSVVCPNNVTISRPSNACEASTGTCGVSFGFSGSYAPQRIEKISSNSAGNINFSYAPDSIIITDGNNNSGINGYTITRFRSECSGSFTFTWKYRANTVNHSNYVNQPFYRVTGGQKTLLTGFNEHSLAYSQNGTVSISVNAGDVIDVILMQANNGASGAKLTLSGLLAPKLTPSILQPVINEQCSYTFTSNLKSSYPPGINTVLYKITDVQGNLKQCSQQITVTDGNAVSATCRQDTAKLYLNKEGVVSPAPSTILSSCLSNTNTVSSTSYSCANTGINTLTATVTNSLNQSSSCNSKVLVLDTIKPTLKFNVLDFTINPSITNTVPSNLLMTMGQDNCPVQSVTVSKTDYACTDIGMNDVIFTVTDSSGNSKQFAGKVNVIPTGFSVTNELGEQRVCSGDTAVFSITAANVATYQWQKELTNIQYAHWDTTLPAPGMYLPASQFKKLMQYSGQDTKSKMIKRKLINGAEWLYIASHNGTNFKVQQGNLYSGGLVWSQWPTASMGHNGNNLAGDPSGNSPFDIAVGMSHGPSMAGINGSDNTNGDAYFLRVTVPDQNGYPSLTYPPNTNTYDGSFRTSNVKLAYSDNYYGSGYANWSTLYCAHTRVFYSDIYNNSYRITVQKRDYYTGVWSLVGPENFGPPVSAFDMVSDGTNNNNMYIAMVASNGKLSVMRNVVSGGNTNWVFVGSAEFASAQAYRNSQLKLTFYNNVPYVAYFDTDKGNKLTVKKLVGTQWVTVGTPGFSNRGSDDVSLIFHGDGVPYVSYSRYDCYQYCATTGNPLTTDVYRFINGAWEPFGPSVKNNITNSDNSQAFSSIQTFGDDIYMFTLDSGNLQLKQLKLWENIPGATNDTLQIPATMGMEAKRVRCIYGTGCADRISNPGYVYVDSTAAVLTTTGAKLMSEAPGVVNISARPSYGQIEWFAQDGITSLGAGTTFQTPVLDSLTYQDVLKTAYRLTPTLDSTTVYYARAVDGRCKSSAVPVVAHVPFTEHNSFGDTVCRGERAIIHIENQQADHKYQIYTKNVANQDSLVTWFVAEEGYDRQVAIDNSQQTKNFTIKNSLYNKDALSLLEYGDYVEFGHLGTDNNGTGMTSVITVEAVINKPSAGNGFPALSYSNKNCGDDMSQAAFVWLTGYFYVNKGGTTYSLAFPELPVGKTHVVTVASNTEMRIYYNGVTVAQTTNITNQPINIPSNPTFIIGQDGRFPAGMWDRNSQVGFDNLRVWWDETYKWNYNINTFRNRCYDGNETSLLLACDFDDYIGDTTVISKKGNNGRWYAQSPRYGRELGQETCLTKDSIWMDTVTVVVKQIDGLPGINTYFEGCAGSPIQMNLASGLDSLKWLDSPDAEFPIAINYGDTFLTTLGPDSSAVFYISDNAECASAEVFAYANPIATILSVTGDTLCAGDRFWDNRAEVETSQSQWGGQWSYNFYADTVGWELAEDHDYGTQVPDGDGGTYSILQNNFVMYAQAYSSYIYTDTGDYPMCTSPRIPVHVVVRKPLLTSYTSDTSFCEGGTANLHATGTEGVIEWRKGWTLVGTGPNFTAENLTSTTNYKVMVNAGNDDDFYCNSVEQPIVVNVINPPIRTEYVFSTVPITWIDGVTYSSSNYSAIFNRPGSAGGCDSMIYLNLTIQPLSDQNVSVDNSSVCSGDSVAVTIDDTQENVNYILRNNSDNSIVSGPLTGTGNSLTFNTGALTSSTSFKVLAEDMLNAPSKALQFNATYSYAEIFMDVPSTDLTHELWFKTTVPSQGIFTTGYEDWMTSNDKEIYLSDGNIVAGAHDNYANASEFITTSNTNYADGQWHHVAHVLTSGQGHKLYVDGSLNASGSLNSTTWWNHRVFLGISKVEPQYLFNGSIDEVRLWNVPRTQAEIQASMYTCLSGNEPGLARYYKLDDGKGSSVITDASPNGSSGNLVYMDPVKSWVVGVKSCGPTFNTYKQMGNLVNIQVNAPSSGSASVVACNSYHWVANGNTYTSSGTYTATLTGANGCDSLATLNLVVTGETNSTYTVTAIGSYTWQGTTYNASGTYTDTLSCGAVTTLYLTVNFNISGAITYGNSEVTPMSNVKVYLYNQGSPVDSAVTATNGDYSFAPKPSGNYTIVSNTIKAWGGVNATDALLVQNHFAGNITLAEPHIGAGDVNASNSVNTSDALVIKKRFVGTIASFNSGDWYFNPQPVVVTNDNVTMNYKGVCFGDVNGSLNPSSAKNGSLVSLVEKGTINLTPGVAVKIPVSAANAMQVGAISLVLTYPQNMIGVLSVSAVTPKLNNLISNVGNGQVRISWSSLQTLSINPNDTLFTVTMQVLPNVTGGVNFEVGDETEFADASGNIISVTLNVPAMALETTSIVTVGPTTFKVNVYPNPVSTTSTLLYTLPETGKVMVRLYDINGRLISNLLSQNQLAGDHSLTLNSAGLATGIYNCFFTLDNGESVITEKKTIVVVK